MSLENAKVSEIKNQIVAGLQQALNQTIPLLPKAFNRVLAKVLAAVFIMLWKYSGAMFLNMFAGYASDQPTTVNGVTFTPLTEIGRLVGAGDPTAAVQAEFLLSMGVVNQTGSLLSGTGMMYEATGVTYVVVGDVPLSAPQVLVPVRAAGDQAGGDGAGAIGNLELASFLTFISQPPNVDTEGQVISQSVTGVDAESTPAYRQRIINFFAKRPQGGAYADYEGWGLEEEGIINVYPYTGGTTPTSGPGQTDLYSETTTDIDPDGIPTTAQLAAVKEQVELNEAGRATRRNTNAYVNSYPITRTPFTVEVSALSVPNNQAQAEADIIIAVEEYFWGRAPYIPGVSLLPRKDQISNTAVGGVVSDIVEAAGGSFSGVIVREGVTIIDVRMLTEGEKSKASSVTFP